MSKNYPFSHLRFTFVLLVQLLLLPFASRAQVTACYQPISGRHVTVTQVQGSLLCVNCTNITDSRHITDADENSFASYSAVSLLSGDGISVRDSVRTFPGGWRAGFVLSFDNSLLSLNILNSFSLSTYDNGVLRETRTSANGLNVSLLGNNSGKMYLSMPTTLSFDEVRLVFTNALSATGYRIYSAMAFDVTCGLSDNNTVCYDQMAGPSTQLSFNGGLANALVTLANDGNITDGDKNTYATLSLPAGVSLLSTVPYVGVTEKEIVHPAGSKAGFVIGVNASLLTADVLNTMSIKTYLFGEPQDSGSFSNAAGLLSVKLLSGSSSDQKELSITTTKPFNEVRLEIAQPASVNVGSIKIYYAFESNGNCGNGRTPLLSTTPAPDNGSINASRTNTFGVICLGQSMTGTANVVDGVTTNAATYIPAILSVGCGARISVQNTNVDYPAGTYAGFVIAKMGGLLDLNLLNAVTVNLYKDGSSSPVASSSGASLLSLGLANDDDSLTTIGFKPTVAFDEIQIVFDAGLISASLGGSYRIYYAFVVKDSDNDGVPDDHDICAGNDAIDSDGDGTPDACDNCTPLDNKKALYADRDGDGVKDACDADSDDDGIADAVEDRDADSFFADDDADQDGIPNYLDLDSDNDAIPDLFESGLSATVINNIDGNKNAVIDMTIARGANGMADIAESADVLAATNNYVLANKDGDSVPDYTDLDSDNDGINDLIEYNNGSLADVNKDGMVDGDETDRDGILDQADGSPLFGTATLALALDTDGDGTPDFRDLDSDNDLISDLVEGGYTGPASNTGVLTGADNDGDGIIDSRDGNDIAFGDAGYINPNNTDNDALPNYIDPDSDNDNKYDIVENGNGWQDMNGDGAVDNFTDGDNDGISNTNGSDGLPTTFGGLGITTLLNVKVLLQGALASPADTLMRDDLRQQSLIPLTQPYNASLSPRFAQTMNSGNEHTSISVLSNSANTPNAIVDWIFIEFRSAANPSTVLKTLNGLVQRDGDIVGADGNELGAQLTDNSYYLAIKHRNHLGIMTASPSVINGVPVNIDFRSTSAVTYGTNAQRSMASGKNAMRGGDVNRDGMIYYTAPSNDRDALLLTLSGNEFGYLTTYNSGDVNFDAQTYYTAPANDRDWILYHALNGSEFGFVSEQLP